MREQTNLLAVLIDADNTSPKYTKAIFDEIATLGEASVRRCYGDFSSQQMAGWSRVQAEFGLVPHHQPANTVGKNASDIALVIDAMDLLHSGRFDGFVLVSSDSDFTRLASRVREQGLDVYGMGQRKTPDAFRKACKRFIFLENIGEDEVREAPSTRSLEEARNLIFKAMEGIEQGDEWYTLGQIGQFIIAANPDFDTRSYGQRKLSDLVAKLKVFETRKGAGNQLLVRRVD
ncbi:NYN domain-containing protein [Marinovum sp. 2_MG-2023]|uniref:NYN domain-containing protein n=1 Tax=Roseobacteraceae TaxID=2854170 RepID=UPI001FD3BAD0|nr:MULTISPECIES: NYN domain-containing protein [Roseobacteraceae]MCJ7871397.1 NYN domain-containing protein [Phaeobacter sp. J2-8]MDO6731540.1 NYN domain-containing protein [Marinovum sp. 2_MG-2023]MDO6780900.1 NYN domain-containing protein [Marinovum sp. 1_MG-2023]